MSDDKALARSARPPRPTGEQEALPTELTEPGDRARPHRHTAAAIRFATRAEGAVTIVNGRRCERRCKDSPSPWGEGAGGEGEA